MASSGPQASTIAVTIFGLATASFLGYAVYFDYQRRNNPEFRKTLKKQSRKQAKAAKVEAEQGQKKERETVRAMVEEANEEGFPDSAEEKEAMFMQEVSKGEQLLNDPSLQKEAALSFYKALRVYPQPMELMGIYDKTVPKPVLDIIAEMVAYNRHITESSVATSSAGVE